MIDPKLMTQEALREIVRKPFNSKEEEKSYDLAKAELEFRQDEEIERRKLKTLQEQDDLLREFQNLVETQNNVIFLVAKGLEKIVNLSKKRNRWIALTIFLLAAVIIPVLIGTGVNILTELVYWKFPWLPRK